MKRYKLSNTKAHVFFSQLRLDDTITVFKIIILNLFSISYRKSYSTNLPNNYVRNCLNTEKKTLLYWYLKPIGRLINDLTFQFVNFISFYFNI
jgi:hypothetical protein